MAVSYTHLGAIECANWVSTVSPTYAQEILDPWFSHKLDPILRERSWKLSGILNGIDTVNYDPSADPNIYAHYSREDKANKAVNKQKLQERLCIEQNPVPVSYTHLDVYKRQPLRWLLGLLGHRLFCPHLPLWPAPGLYALCGPLPPGGHRRHYGLGSRPFPPGRGGPGLLRRDPLLRV